MPEKGEAVEDEDEDDDDDEDEDEEEWEDASVDGSVVYVIDEDEDNDSTSSDSRCPCNFHAPHWSGTLNAERVVIRDLVQERLHTIFETTPSLRLYNILISISDTKPASSPTYSTAQEAQQTHS